MLFTVAFSRSRTVLLWAAGPVLLCAKLKSVLACLMICIVLFFSSLQEPYYFVSIRILSFYHTNVVRRSSSGYGTDPGQGPIFLCQNLCSSGLNYSGSTKLLNTVVKPSYNQFFPSYYFKVSAFKSFILACLCYLFNKVTLTTYNMCIQRMGSESIGFIHRPVSVLNIFVPKDYTALLRNQPTFSHLLFFYEGELEAVWGGGPGEDSSPGDRGEEAGGQTARPGPWGCPPHRGEIR